MKSEIATKFQKFLSVIDVRDRRQFSGIMIKNSFMGSEAIDAILGAGLVKTRQEGIRLVKRFQKELRVFRQVRGGQKFQDKRLLYRLTIPDSIKDEKAVSEIIEQCPKHWKDYSKLELKDKAQLFFRLAQVQDRTFRFKKYRSCFMGCEIVDRMVYTGLAETREASVQLGIELAKEMKIFVHVSGKNWFADDSSLYVFSEGVLSVIYEVQLAEKNQNAAPGDNKSSVVAAALLAPSQEKKLSPFERMMQRGRGKKTQTNTAFVGLASDDEDNSVMSAPEMSQAGSLDESNFSVIGLSNSFDTLGDLVAKYGWGNESVLTFKLEEDLKRKNSSHVKLGGAYEAEQDASAANVAPASAKKSPPPPPVYEDDKEERSEEQSIVSEPELEESVEDSPRTVTDYRVLAYSPANGGGKKRRNSAEMKSLSLNSIKTLGYLSTRNIDSIFVDHSSTSEEEMTQITMDNALTTSSSDEDIGRLVSANNPEQSNQSPFRAHPKSYEQSPHRHQHHQQRPHSYSGKYSVSQQTSSSYSQVSADSTTKHRIAEILRKELWKTHDDSMVAFAMEELCRIMAMGSSHKAYVVHCGGVMALMRTMEEYMETESIQFYCCSALAALASLDLDTQSAVSEMDGIPLVVRSMQSHGTSSRLQEACRSALAAICYDSQV